jgi:hypothetical protein
MAASGSLGGTEHPNNSRKTDTLTTLAPALHVVNQFFHGRCPLSSLEQTVESERSNRNINWKVIGPLRVTL